jgi:hypothetical protein
MKVIGRVRWWIVNNACPSDPHQWSMHAAVRTRAVKTLRTLRGILLIVDHNADVLHNARVKLTRLTSSAGVMSDMISVCRCRAVDSKLERGTQARVEAHKRCVHVASRAMTLQFLTDSCSMLCRNVGLLGAHRRTNC